MNFALCAKFNRFFIILGGGPKGPKKHHFWWFWGSKNQVFHHHFLMILGVRTYGRMGPHILWGGQNRGF